MVVTRTGRCAGTHVVRLAGEVVALHGARRQAAFRNAIGRRRNVPGDPVEYVTRVAPQGHVDVVEDDRVAHGSGGRVGELEPRLNPASTGELLRDDAAVGKRICFHQERWQTESAAAAAAADSLRLLSKCC